VVELKAENVGKKFGRHWVFRNLSYELKTGDSLVVTGKNGAGKSTFLKIISGYLSPTEGNIFIDEAPIDDALVNRNMVSPDLEIIEEFSLHEFLKFHSKFRAPKFSYELMAENAALPLTKMIKDFSTGMKQRVKLITSFYFENDMLFLDEPSSNLDTDGFKWFKREFNNNKSTTIIVLATNNNDELGLCDERVEL